MLDRSRLSSKKVSKTEAVQSQLSERLEDDQIHAGPSDCVAWQNDNKVCFLRMEGRGFASIPLQIELRLSVEDSPNRAGVAIDAIRLCKPVLDHSISSPLLPACARYMKHPPVQMKDVEASEESERFLSGPAGLRRPGPYEEPMKTPVPWPTGYPEAKEKAMQGQPGPQTRYPAFGKGSHRRCRAGGDPNPTRGCPGRRPDLAGHTLEAIRRRHHCDLRTEQPEDICRTLTTKVG